MCNSSSINERIRLIRKELDRQNMVEMMESILGLIQDTYEENYDDGCEDESA